MQVEVLKFLMDASEQLGEMRRSHAEARDESVDLQAVERVLPDCDWFELGEVPATAYMDSESGSDRRSVALEF